MFAGEIFIPVLFVGGIELLLVAAVALVLIFGSKAPEIANDFGEATGELRKSKHEVQREIEQVEDELSVEPDQESVTDDDEDDPARRSP